jgi:hypothetical protein
VRDSAIIAEHKMSVSLLNVLIPRSVRLTLCFQKIKLHVVFQQVCGTAIALLEGVASHAAESSHGVWGLLMGFEVDRGYVGRCGLDDPYCLEEIE